MPSTPNEQEKEMGRVLYDLLTLAIALNAPGQTRMRLQDRTEERKKEAGSSRGIEFEGIGESRQPHRLRTGGAPRPTKSMRTEQATGFEKARPAF
ncbi:MAG: hypothetical protein EHM55_19830 [Acidobacteria bacterium]|nr:MAG: hypothetical protein EHM55_19830 [Acidobacteriota bacterium]